MQSISSLFNSSLKYEISNRKETWRTFYENEALAYINEERKPGTFYIKDGKKILIKKLTLTAIHWKTKHLRTEQDWHFLLSICKDAKNRSASFSKTFFGSIGVK